MPFKKVTFGDLDDLTGVVQCMDDQWVPRAILEQMARNDQRRRVFEDAIASSARREFMRSMLTCQQLVLNRPAFYNHRTFADAFRNPVERSAVTELLDTGAVVPFLFDESDPSDDPRAGSFSFRKTQKTAWESMLKSSTPHVLRLSWDDAENSQLINSQLGRRFGEFCQNLRSLNEYHLLDDFGLPREAENIRNLRAVLREISNFSADVYDSQREDSQSPFVTRTQINKRFVWADGSDGQNFKFDKQKQFGSLVKQVIDLKYNLNLPDCMTRYSIAASDTPSRSTLQEISLLTANQARCDLADICGILGTQAIELASSEIDIPSSLMFADLSFLRRTELWTRHITTFRGTLPRPGHKLAEHVFFQDISGSVLRMQKSYLEVIDFLAGISEERRYHAKVEMDVEFWLTVIGTGVKIVFKVLKHGGVGIDIPPDLLKHVETAVAPVVVELVLKLRGNMRHEQQGISVKVPVLMGKIEAIGDQVEKVRRLLASSELRRQVHTPPPHAETGSSMRSAGLETYDAN